MIIASALFAALFQINPPYNEYRQDPHDVGLQLLISLLLPRYLYSLVKQYPAKRHDLLSSTEAGLREFLKLPTSAQIASELSFVDHCQEVYRAVNLNEEPNMIHSVDEADVRRLDFIAIILGKPQSEVFYRDATGHLAAHMKDGRLVGYWSGWGLYPQPEASPPDFARARKRIKSGFYLPDKKAAPSPG
jgi:hypothetical protein